MRSAQCYRVLKDGGLLAFTFHQARIGGWQALVSALADASFQITAIQPIKGEMSTSSTKHGREPSNLDSIVLCRKTQEVPESKTSPAEAAVEAEHKLSALREAGIKVGAGDVRSVVRGHLHRCPRDHEPRPPSRPSRRPGSGCSCRRAW